MASTVLPKMGGWGPRFRVSGALYEYGTLYDAVTGGQLVPAKIKSTSGSSASSRAPTITEAACTIVVDNTRELTGGIHGGMAYFPSKIDLTNYEKLVVEGLFTKGGASNTLVVACWTDIPSYYMNSVAAVCYFEEGTDGGVWDGMAALKQYGKMELDVSGLTGEYYLGFGLTMSSVMIEAIYLE